ncbi:MAG TPA: nuclear transport factor 2 family protein [Candidatus Acidoferrum sp.]|nr:nuclear transport factor 2 family protein [Candidatus Acidoferrum sp.]
MTIAHYTTTTDRHSSSLRNITTILLGSLLLQLAACSKPAATISYADDRAQVENLLSRYAFALDWQDADLYASLFTDDGVLDWAGGVIKGRDAIRNEVHKMRDSFAQQEKEDAPLRPARLRHFITNVVLDVQGDNARVREFWVEFNNRNAERKAISGAYGHNEDELRRVNGQWLFVSRKIFNEEMPQRSATMTNPAW